MARIARFIQNFTATPQVNGVDLVVTNDTRLDADRTRKISYGTSAPGSPSTGDLWLDTTV
jgi:hypothetical protein